jgi:hypothetical protein
MRTRPHNRSPQKQPVAAMARQWQLFTLLMLVVFLCGAGQAQTPDVSETELLQADTRVQVLDGRISNAGLQLYRISSLTRGAMLSVHAEITSGHLDPLVALLKPDASLEALSRESLDEQIKILSRDHDPLEVSRQIMERYSLAWNDDYQGHYLAAFNVEIPADGDYWLAVGSSLVRSTAGGYRLRVGVDAPEVLSGQPESSGAPFVFFGKDTGELDRGVVLVSDELRLDQPRRYYYLADLAAGQMLYAYAEAISGDLKPVLTLYDYSDKPVAYANFFATDDRAVLQQRLPQMAERYRLGVTSQGPDGKATAGSYRLLIGLNAPEVMNGKGEPTGREIVREPIPVSIGVKMQQLTGVNQKSENFGVVATVLMHWRDPRLAFDPEKQQDRFKVFVGDAFSAEMSRQGQPWPQYTIVNQQNRLWVQNRVVVVRPDGETIYFERVSLTLQAPDFDFRNFPFDKQNFFIRFDLLAPEWMYQLREIEGYSEIGKKLGEEEWVITDFDTNIVKGSILQNPVSRFNFEFSAKRHIAYYFFRILLPLVIIISVSWILFFLKDYAKRVDAAGANLLLFIAFNFAISNDLPRLGYLTFLDTLLISAFMVTAVVLILSVYLRRQDMQGREAFVAKVDRYVIIFYPLAYALAIISVAMLFS